MIKAVIFDFDGTLVLSNHIKYDAWFDVFGSDQALLCSLKKVLATDLESSRFVIIRKVLEQASEQAYIGRDLEKEIKGFADQYNDKVLNAVKGCKEVPGAENILTELKTKVSLYCSSNTPEKDLIDILKHKKWDLFFKRVYGFPHQKNETIIRIMAKEGIPATELLVVGDGASDRVAAESVGAHFLHITEPDDLRAVVGYLSR